MRSAKMFQTQNKMNCLYGGLWRTLMALMFPTLLLAQWVPTDGPYGGFIFAITPKGTDLFVGTPVAGVFRSTDNGANWTAVNNGLTPRFVHSFAVMGSNLFAGTEGGGVFLSTNNGDSWTAANTGITAADIGSILVSGTDLFACERQGGGVFRSTNNGTSWTAVNTGLSNGALEISALTRGGTNPFAATNGNGVFLSPNNGTIWRPLCNR